MQIRPSVSRKVHLNLFYQMHCPDYKRVLLTIQPYDFEIKYILGIEVAVVDASPESTLEMGGNKGALILLYMK